MPFWCAEGKFAAKGYGAEGKLAGKGPWGGHSCRRQNSITSGLFDFQLPNYQITHLPNLAAPSVIPTESRTTLSEAEGEVSPGGAALF
jgi:hypothetical protein